MKILSEEEKEISRQKRKEYLKKYYQEHKKEYAEQVKKQYYKNVGKSRERARIIRNKKLEQDSEGTRKAERDYMREWRKRNEV